MKECIHNRYILNGELQDCNSFNPCYLDEGISVYEVIRVINGLLLFKEDHYHRLISSLDLSGQHFKPGMSEFSHYLQQLLDANDGVDGNVKIVVNFRSDIDPCFLLYYIPHRYPTDLEYEHGISLSTLQFVREEPNKKIWRSGFRKKVNGIIASTPVYEVLLVSPEGFITEASKANIFFLKEETLFTPPAGTVLAGITRKYIFSLCEQLGIPLYEKNILYNELDDFTGAFITGTSPKVLPAKGINGVRYDVGHQMIRQLMLEFERIIGEYFRNC